MDQEDQGDHNPPWWTRTGFYILLMSSQTHRLSPIVSTVIGSTPPLPLQVSSLCSVTARGHSLSWHTTALPALAIATVAPLGHGQLSYSTALVADVNALGFQAMFAPPRWFLLAPAPPLFLFH